VEDDARDRGFAQDCCSCADTNKGIIKLFV
jgi:hypothetical protein